MRTYIVRSVVLAAMIMLSFILSEQFTNYPLTPWIYPAVIFMALVFILVHYIMGRHKIIVGSSEIWYIKEATKVHMRLIAQTYSYVMIT